MPSASFTRSISGALEDPLLEQLLRRKAPRARRAADHAGDAQHARVPVGVDVPVRRDQRRPAGGCRSDPRGRRRAASRAAKASARARSPTPAAALAGRYRDVDPAFAPDIQVRDDIAGLMVSGKKLFVGTNTIDPRQPAPGAAGP